MADEWPGRWKIARFAFAIQKHSSSRNESANPRDWYMLDYHDELTTLCNVFFKHYSVVGRPHRQEANYNQRISTGTVVWRAINAM